MSDYSATFPPQRPVFSADFAQSGKIDPRATFSRSDSPIDVGKAAAAAVHYWSNEKHLSSENLIPNSNASQAWQTVRVTRTTSGSFLDGSNSFLIAEKSDTGSHYTSPNSSVNATNFVSGTEYTAVVYAKAGTDNVIQLAFPAGYFTSNAYANFDLSNASTTPVTGSAATATITALGSDWVKLTLTAPATATGAAVGVVVAFIQNDINGARIPSYAGDTASNVYVWEANVSSTGQTVLNQTSGQIHREYAPTLKSVATAGAARFEYDPTDGQSAGTSLGCLIESQATNLYGNSLDMTGVSQARTNIDLNVAVGPTGQLTADAIRLDATNSDTHTREYSFTAAASTAYTFSVYLKAAGMTHAVIRPNNLFAESYVYFNLSNGTVEGSPTLANSMTAVGNGFYRCSVTATTSGSGAGSFNIYITDSASSTTVATGDSYRAILGQGIQIEAGSHPSSFIQTSGGSTATRASDSLSVATADIGYTGGPFTIVSETEGGKGSYPRAWTITDGISLDNRLTVYRNSGSASGSTDWFCYATSGGSAQVSSTITSSASAGKLAVSYDTNDVSFCASGGTVGTDNSAVIIDGLATLRIGAQTNGVNNQLNGHVKRVALYNEALSDTNLQALTS